MTDIVLVTPDGDFEAAVKRAFDGDYTGERFWDASLTRMHPALAVERIAAPPSSVVVLGPKLSTPTAIDIAAAFDHRRPDVCTVVVATPSAKTLELALRAGARDVIGPDASPEELRSAFGRALETVARRQATTTQAPPQRPLGRLITVLGPKGGTGKTMVATNLAMSLAGGAPWQVVLVDLDLQFGDVANAISLNPEATFGDAGRAGESLTNTAVKVFLEPHPSGFYALCAPTSPAEADEVSSTTVGHILDLLVAEFGYVVVDTAAGLDEHALAATERSTDLLLVCSTDVPSVRSMRKAIDALDLLGTKAQRHLVLNRADARVGLSQRDIEATIGLPVDLAVPSSRNVPISLNQGSPMVEADRRSPTSRALLEFADGFLAGGPARSVA